MDIEEGWLRRLVTIMAAAIFVLMIAGLLLIFSGNGSVPPSPREVFESHLAALDTGDWAYSDTFVKDECTIGSAAGVANLEAALADVLESGFSFRRAFDVEEVWISEDGTEAILDLNTLSGLPSVATLELVEGKWLVAC